MKKRILVLVLCIGMVFGNAASVYADENTVVSPGEEVLDTTYDDAQTDMIPVDNSETLLIDNAVEESTVAEDINVPEENTETLPEIPQEEPEISFDQPQENLVPAVEQVQETGQPQNDPEADFEGAQISEENDETETDPTQEESPEDISVINQEEPDESPDDHTQEEAAAAEEEQPAEDVDQTETRYSVALMKTEGGSIRFSERMTLPERDLITDERMEDLRSFPANTEIIIEVIPDEGYELQSIIAESGSVTSLNYEMYYSDFVYMLTLPEDNVMISAYFAESIKEASSDSGEEKSEIKLRSSNEDEDIIPVSEIVLDQSNIVINEDENADLTVTVLPENATNQNVSWSSSNEEVASVNSSGRVTANGEGTAVITATTEDGGYTAVCTVKVEAQRINSTSGICGENLTWSLDEEGVLTISGIGDMYDFQDNEYNYIKTVPWEAYYGVIKKVVIENGVTSIGTAAFNPDRNGCYENKNTVLESVIISDSVKRIGHSAFAWCQKLKEIHLPSGISAINKNMFFDCQSLVSISLPVSVCRIEDGAFCRCVNLQEIMIPNGDTEIETGGYFDGAFTDCSNLTIYSQPGSRVEQYANENGIRFIAIGEEQEGGKIAVNEENFPDSRFRKWIQTNYGNELSQAEINSTKKLSFSGGQDLTGLSYFTEVKELTLTEGEFDYQEVKQLPKLEKLTLINIYSSGVLDLTGCMAVKEINISVSEESAISSLDLSNLLTLEQVYLYAVCDSNYYMRFIKGGVNLSGCTALKTVNASGGMTSLTLDGCTALTKATLADDYYNSGCISFRTTTGTIDLSETDPWVDGSRIYNLKGAELTGTTLSNCTSRVSYSYDCGEGYTKYVVLNIDIITNVTGISFSSETYDLNVDDHVILDYTVIPENATNKRVSWSSSNVEAASVDSNGRVTANGEGTAVITVTTEDGGYTASCTVNISVQEDETVTVNEENFPDSRFRKWIQTNYGNELSKVEINSTEKLSFSGGQDLTGLSYFTEVKELTLTEGEYDYQEVKQLPKLEKLTLLNIYSSGILDLTGCIAVKTITISCGEENGISSLDLSNLLTLEQVMLYAADYENMYFIKGGVNLSGCTALKTLNVYGGMTSLTLDGCTALTKAVLYDDYYGYGCVSFRTNTGTIDLSEKDPWIDGSRIYNLKGAELTGTTLSNCTSRVSYSYDCGEGYTKNVALVIDIITNVTGIGFSSETYDLNVDDHVILDYTVIPENATNKGVSWSSSNEEVASVENNGRVTAKGEGTAVITATTEDGGYTASCTVNVVAQSIHMEKTVIADIAEKTYTGNPLVPAPKVTYNTTTLKNGTDYTVSYENNINAGTATITVTGKGNYTGTKTATFKINPKSITPTVTLGATKYIYDGKAKEPSVIVKDGSAVLKNGTDYSVSYCANTTVGKASIQVTLTGNYKGSKTTNFTIVPPAPTLSSVMNTATGVKVTWTKVASAGGYYVYRSTGTGSAVLAKTITSNATVTYTDTAAATNNTKYTYYVVAYKTVSDVAYKSANSGTKFTYFMAKMAAPTLANTATGVKVTWKQATGANGYYIYRSTGSGSAALAKTITSGSTLTYTDTAAATNNTKYTYYVVAYKTVSDVKYKSANSATKFTYFMAKMAAPTLANTATGVKVTWKQATGANGYYIYRSTGTGSAALTKTITSGSTLTYTDTAAKTNNTKYTYYVVAYKTVNDVKYKSVNSATKVMYYISKPTISTLKSASENQVTVGWSKNSTASGYQVQYSQSSTFASGNKSVTVTGSSTVSKTITGLTTGKTYYGRVRTYKTVGSTKYYSTWSATKCMNPDYTIVYNLNGGVNNNANPATYKTTSAEITLKNPTKKGYRFVGWYTDAKFTKKFTSIPQGSKGEKTVYAKWTAVKYTITYILNGGTAPTGNPASYYVITATTTLKNPTRKGYTFLGWYSDAAFTTKVTSIVKGSTGNKTLYARWKLTDYTIVYNLNGGVNNSANPATYKMTSVEITLKNPTKKGYKFAGWYTDAKFTKKFISIPKGSTGKKTVYAKWTAIKYTITYKLNGGTAPTGNPASYYITTATITLKNPTRKGYTFLGWYSDAAFTTKVTSIVKGSTGNKTLYARWKLTDYTIVYNLNGGVNNSANPATYKMTSAEITLKSPTKKGYKFAGWYTDAEFTKKYTSIPTGSTGKKTVYAKWTAIKYTIKYVLNGGTAPTGNPDSYYVTTATITLKEPTKKGYEFIGWYSNATYTKEVKRIEKGSAGNIVLYACWKDDGTPKFTGKLINDDGQWVLYIQNNGDALLVTDYGPILANTSTILKITNPDRIFYPYTEDLSNKRITFGIKYNGEVYLAAIGTDGYCVYI